MFKPIVLHFNGGKWRKKSKLLINKLLDNIKQREYNSESDLDIIVCNNNNVVYMTEQSLNRLGVKYIKLGKNVNWISNGLKIKLCYEYLKKCKKEYVMHLDGRDVLILDTPDKVIERFKRMGCDILFNAEANFHCKIKHIDYEYGQRIKRYEEEEHKDCYVTERGHRMSFLNSGCWIAKKDYVLRLFEECMRDYKKYGMGCDQSLLHEKYYQNDGKNIRVDIGCEIFQCMLRCLEGDIRV